jgi:imidazoleglycerol-phosphate dehydratase/histidinol-phosphatase
MLVQIAKHAKIDIQGVVKGDLYIDEHHTIEDVGIALGEAFSQALGDKRGIARYGHFTLPMDEAQAQVALDFSGRSFLKWKDEFKREKVGEMPVEMVKHFFESLANNARINLHVSVTGENDHHQIEAIFKAFAKAVKMAIKIEGNEIPSSKGVL